MYKQHAFYEEIILLRFIVTQLKLSDGDLETMEFLAERPSQHYLLKASLFEDNNVGIADCAVHASKSVH